MSYHLYVFILSDSTSYYCGEVFATCVIVKVGKPTECSRPGSRRKGDSQVLLVWWGRGKVCGCIAVPSIWRRLGREIVLGVRVSGRLRNIMFAIHSPIGTVSVCVGEVPVVVLQPLQLQDVMDNY